MAFSITDILRDLGVEDTKLPTVAPENAEKTASIEEPDIEKVAEYLDHLASPDSLIDELAKLAVLQDWAEANQLTPEMISQLSWEYKDNERVNMLKSAGKMVKELSKENKTLKKKESHRKCAESVAKKMCSAGHIAHNQILDKVAELMESSEDELKTYDKALDLTKMGKALPFGSLSDKRNSDATFTDYIMNS